MVEELLGEDADHAGVPLKAVFFENPVPLQTQLHVPQGAQGVGCGLLLLPHPLVVLGHSPELNEWSHEQAFVALCADVSQTYHQVVLQQALHHDVLVHPLQVEVDRQPVHHLVLLVLQIPVHHSLQLLVWDVPHLSVLYELGQCSKEHLFSSGMAQHVVGIPVGEGDQ